MNFKKILMGSGISGMLITVLLSPCCFPLLGFALTALGFGSFELFGEWTMYVFQAFTLISLVGLILSYRIHRCTYPLLIAIPCVSLVFYAYYISSSDNWQIMIYIGIVGLLIATIVNWHRTRLHKKGENCCMPVSNLEVQLKSVITCPNCGYKKEEEMPTDACQFFYECENCKTRLKPKQGDCCVFCSYGSVPCPPIQMDSKCC